MRTTSRRGSRPCPSTPYTMAQGAGALIEEVAQTKMTGEEDRYSGTDLLSIQANVDGSQKIVDILRPTLGQVDAGYLARLDAAFAARGRPHRPVPRR